MDHFLYKDGVLHAEDVALPEIAAAVGTPFYVYSAATLTRHFRLFDEALAGTDHLVCFAIKSLTKKLSRNFRNFLKPSKSRPIARNTNCGAPPRHPALSISLSKPID